MLAPSLAEIVGGFRYLETPRWRDGRLYFSDLFNHQVYAAAVGDSGPGTVENLASVPNKPSGLGWLPDGRLLIVSMNDRRVLVRDHDGPVTE